MAELAVRKKLCTPPEILHSGAVVAFADARRWRYRLSKARQGARKRQPSDSCQSRRTQSLP